MHASWCWMSDGVRVDRMAHECADFSSRAVRPTRNALPATTSSTSTSYQIARFRIVDGLSFLYWE
jgi:hypothetical protein